MGHPLGRIRGLTRGQFDHGIAQVSLDLTNLDDALRLAEVAVAAGADWLEVGTPLAIAEGVRAVHALRRAYPDHPIVADLKIMDGGYGESRLYGRAGADAVVVMARAHDATIERAADAAREFDLLLMVDDMGSTDPAADAARVESLGAGMVVHHLGHDHRRKHADRGLSPLSDLADVVAATSLPVEAVGGLSIEQAVGSVGLGATVVVFGAPLAIVEEGSDVMPDDQLLQVLTDAIVRVHNQPVVR